jgi:hypothetical protein
MKKILWVRQERILDRPGLRARCTDGGWVSEILPPQTFKAPKGKMVTKADRKVRRQAIRQEFSRHRCSDFTTRSA